MTSYEKFVLDELLRTHTKTVVVERVQGKITERTENAMKELRKLMKVAKKHLNKSEMEIVYQNMKKAKIEGLEE
jgi:hypothetical protein|nr:MAG TPA: hypothetical protein [Bacteriophage sp.]